MFLGGGLPVREQWINEECKDYGNNFLWPTVYYDLSPTEREHI